MSTALLKTAAVAALTATALATTAEAQSRYGSLSGYETVNDCGNACVAPAPVASSRYGSAPVASAPSYDTPVYVDCTQTASCAPVVAQPTTVYTQPTQSYVYTVVGCVYTVVG